METLGRRSATEAFAALLFLFSLCPTLRAQLLICSDQAVLAERLKNRQSDGMLADNRTQVVTEEKVNIHMQTLYLNDQHDDHVIGPAAETH